MSSIVDDTSFIDATAIVENSTIGKNSFLYRCARIVDSKIGENSLVGDFSRITKSSLNGLNRVDRSTLIYHSDVQRLSYFGANTVVMHTNIGSFCSIAWGVTIGAANHDYTKVTTHDFLYNSYYDILEKGDAPVYDRFENKTLIGNDVWIGTNSTIANGVHIGSGAVIGANAMVTKNVPPYAICVGNPARIIKFRFSSDVINDLLNLRWWDFPIEVIKENFHIFSNSDIEKSIVGLKQLRKI